MDSALRKAGLAARAGDIAVTVAKSGAPETYSIKLDGRHAVIEGGDAAGTMYGELEMGERARLRGAQAWKKGTVNGVPFLKDRGLNLFLTLPWNYEANNTDYRPESLTDPDKWWFQNDDYWRMLLNSMARHRMNWLDIHGAWDVSVTDAPNLYAYFIQSDKFPEVGVAPEIKAKNLKQLNKVIEMAHARGIKVSLMAYEAQLSIPQKRDVPYRKTEEVAYEYTKEMVEKMIRQAPNSTPSATGLARAAKANPFSAVIKRP